jgi:hypothetical protein
MNLFTYNHQDSINHKPRHYDIDDIKRNSDLFQSRLKVFENIEPNQKIYIEEETNILKRDDGIVLFPLFITRWWYNQGRDSLLEILKITFDDYSKLLDMLIRAARCNNTNKVLEKLNEDNYEFTKTIEQGLTNIKITYPEFKEIHAEIESMIGYFVDYRILVEDSRFTNETSIITTSVDEVD